MTWFENYVMMMLKRWLLAPISGFFLLLLPSFALLVTNILTTFFFASFLFTTAIWMLPLNNEYGGWPASGEMDIMESRGNLDYVCGDVHEGHQKMGSTLHWGPDSSQNAYYLTSWSQVDEEVPFGDSFRTYGLEWDTEGIRFTLDGELTGEVYPPEGGFWELGGFEGENIWEDGTKMAPFDKEVVMGLGWGGGV